MLALPGYLEKLGLREDKLPIEKFVPNYDVEVDVVQSWMSEASERAKLAFGCAAAEWIVWRIEGVAEVTDMHAFIEAMWATVVDYRYAREIDHEYPDDDFSSKLVLHETWSNLQAIFRRAQKMDASNMDCVCLSLIVRHVLSKKHQKAFKDWLIFAMRERAKIFWQRDPESEDPKICHGEPIPREAFDPDFKFEPSISKELLQKFLNGLDQKANPYLRSPEEMKALGFEGVPYKI